MNLQSTLRDRRVALGLTQRMVAAELGIGHTKLCEHERGKRNTTATMLEKWADVLGVQIEVRPRHGV
jgi:transcriptional regulator with XRE-family HTH domain